MGLGKAHPHAAESGVGGFQRLHGAACVHQCSEHPHFVLTTVGAHHAKPQL